MRLFDNLAILCWVKNLHNIPMLSNLNVPWWEFRSAITYTRKRTSCVFQVKQYQYRYRYHIVTHCKGIVVWPYSADSLLYKISPGWGESRLVRDIILLWAGFGLTTLRCETGFLETAAPGITILLYLCMKKKFQLTLTTSHQAWDILLLICYCRIS